MIKHLSFWGFALLAAIAIGTLACQMPARPKLVKMVQMISSQKPSGTTSISGKWIGSNKITYIISQKNNNFTWTAMPTKGRASGKIEGNRLKVSWVLANRKGTATGRVTQRNRTGQPIRIEWSNGIIFTRPAAPAPQITLTKPKAPALQLKKLPKKQQKITPKVPVHVQTLPLTLLIGDFVLKVENYSNPGQWNKREKSWANVSGTAWVNFQCGGSRLSSLLRSGSMINRYFNIVSTVTNPEDEISLEDARLVKPGVIIGERLQLQLKPKNAMPASILQAKRDYLIDLAGGLKPKKSYGLVRFDSVKIVKIATAPDTGRITIGNAVYPSDESISDMIILSLDGFSGLIDQLVLTPHSANAHIILELPVTMGMTETCGPARLDLGNTTITSDCQFYVYSRSRFGPWIIGDTGLITEGNGFIADFSDSQSPPGRPATWNGLILQNGLASGNMLVPVNSNTGYLAGQYSYSSAIVTEMGFKGTLMLSANHMFEPINPPGYKVTATSGEITLSESMIISGYLRNGTIEAPRIAVCDNSPGNPLMVSFTSLAIREDLSLSGRTGLPLAGQICWGELTHMGEELIFWRTEISSTSAAYFYLPGGPAASFSPDTGSGFLSFACSGPDDLILKNLTDLNMTGITIGNLKYLQLHSPDRPGGMATPLQFINVNSAWLNISACGVNANFALYINGMEEALGNNERSGYVGNLPFDITLKTGREKLNRFLFADSAVYESELNGSAAIPEPSGIPDLPFMDMEVTSAGNLVGGNIHLDTSGVELSYWKLKMASTSESGDAGIMSIRTGRILYNAARISEEVHFDNEYDMDSMIPFPLTWGEMLADGNFGELFLNPNTYGQRFDGIPFSPKNFILSSYVQGATDGYFEVCGTMHFNFFGSAYVNIRDTRYDSRTDFPYLCRYVTVPLRGESGTEMTNLTLEGEWNNKSALLNFPNNSMGYNETIQNGFIGTGTTDIDLIQSDPLDATIEVHRESIDICLSSSETHDLKIPSYPNAMCGINEIYGCIRIEGPVVERIALGGYMENSSTAGSGILAPKEASCVEINLSMTPSSTIFYSAGEMLLAVASSSVDVSGQIRLAIDRSRHSAEGEVMGRVDCEAVLAGLLGEGQMTWFLSPEMWYFQGRVKIAVCSWTGGAGLEGGFFIGTNVPKEKAWVLYSGSEMFGVDESILPKKLTGLYGYGQLSFSVTWYVFSGGVEIYTGMGAFSIIPTDVTSGVDWEREHDIGLPYILGSMGVHVHGEILGGLVAAAAWGDLDLRGPIPIYFSGTFGLKGCIVWVLCASIDVTAGVSPQDGFFIR